MQQTNLILKSPPAASFEPVEIDLSDAMDKIVEHRDVSFMEPGNWLKFCDCMDLITGRVTELVKTVNLLRTLLHSSGIICQLVPWNWYASNTSPTVKLATLQTAQDLVELGQYFTRSKTKPNK